MSVRRELSLDFDVAAADTADLTVVRVRGQVDVAAAARLRGAVADGRARRLLNGVEAPVVVDLSGVTFMDASGLGALISSVREARRAGTDIVLRNPSQRTLRVLALTGLIDVLEIERHGDSQLRRTA